MMRIAGQQWGHLEAPAGTGPISVAQTVALDSRDISAEIALSTAINGSREGATHMANARITRIVSRDGVEQTMLSVLGRSGTTSITFTLLAWNGAAVARWIINHWE